MPIWVSQLLAPAAWYKARKRLLYRVWVLHITEKEYIISVHAW